MQSGQILRSRYKIIKSLGTGGFGDTYLAQDLDLPGHPKCVVKHLSPKSLDPKVLNIARKLFEREADTLDKLGNDSDQIPKLFAHFQEEREFYLVQEYIEGQDISRELTPRKKLSESDTIALVKGILEALTVAHQNNVIHRDIKPQNLMRRSSDHKIVLIDFGAVKEIDVLTTNQQGATTLTVAVGTPGYMPSEQSNGRPKLSSDIYAVGMVGIKALTGKDPGYLPIDQDTGNIIWRNEAQVSNPLANILDKMVHEYFPQRYQNAMEVLDVLPEMTVEVNSSKPRQTSTAKTSVKANLPQPPTHKTRRQIFILGGLAASGFVGALLTQRFLNKRSQERFSNSISILQARSSPTSLPGLEILIQTFATVIVDRRGEIIRSPRGRAEVIIENIGNEVFLEMVKIPGGRFLMGSPETEAKSSSREGPQHYVDVPEFLMGRYAVTQEQWEAVMGNNPSGFQGASRPVETVSWYDATDFCQKLSQITGKEYTLPSESQWEYACRARTKTPFSFGETIRPELVNYDGNYPYANAPKGIYRAQTTDVGIFLPNSFGLYDMHGNVYEWCQDVWHENYNGAPTDGSAWETGGDSAQRLLRGGCWLNYSWVCRCAERLYGNADNFKVDRGFRVVSSVAIATQNLVK
ncbi:MAG: bifunctional serine/threonine-protein kinase/formylglycine-generating enzyme family protein [Trichodesmium sp. MAG_R04]|nr:bifunctional serine/threonine-protein kinase/formylglycine-generating enzyme family protein [Trichodesmium sp. MAG_R04]